MTTVAPQADEVFPEEDALRAELYDLLGALIASSPSPDLLAGIAALNADGTPLGRSVGALARLAGQLRPDVIRDEYNTLFVGMTRGELMPYASYYMTGFLHEKPLAVLRGEMRRLGIERTPNNFEPEDNIASLCEMMAGLIRGTYGPGGLQTQRDFFNAHLAPWAEHFFTDLEGAKTSVFYAPVGSVGRAFIEIEREAYKLGD